MDAPLQPPPSPIPLQVLHFHSESDSGDGIAMETTIDAEMPTTSATSTFAIEPTIDAKMPTASATSTFFNCKNSATISRRKKMKKENLSSDPHYQGSCSWSSSIPSYSKVSSSRFSRQKKGIRLFSTRRNPKVLSGLVRNRLRCLEIFALPLGMSIAAIVDTVLERKGATEDKAFVDQLSQVSSGVYRVFFHMDTSINFRLDRLVCASAIRESLANVFGDKFNSFVENFEKSFRSTLMTLQLINKSTKISRRRNRKLASREYSSEEAAESSHNELDRRNRKLANREYSSEEAAESSHSKLDNSVNDFGTGEHWSEAPLQASSMDRQVINQEDINGNTMIDLRNQQLILHDRQVMQQLAFVSLPRSSDGSSNNQTILSTLEKSVMEQARLNDLKAFEMGLTMRKIQLKERQLALGSDSNFLERCKLSIGLSKSSFKFEKFKTQLEDTRHSELLKRCIDCLVSGLFVMSACAAYGVFIFSHQRITELTASCTAVEESKSWFMSKTVSNFNSGLQNLKCKFQVLTRMLAGGIMIIVIAYLLLQRSMTSNQTAPVTVLVLLLVICGISGKLCIDTLGGDGNWWLIPWWIFCSIHIFSNIWTSTLFGILNGPITVTEKMKKDPLVPYWLRRFLFYTTSALFLPLLCGLLPFANLREWKDHFSSLFVRHLLSKRGLV